MTTNVNAIDWANVRQALYEEGFARLGTLLDAESCRGIIELYDDPKSFRSHIDMARYRFGRGEYKYFAYPLPRVVSDLRQRLYEGLTSVAGDWMRDLGLERRYPAKLETFLRECHAAEQKRPTPLLLKYGAGDFNALHQDIYGAVFFPFQVICSLSEPDEGYEGGELMLVEQRPRAQSVGHVLQPARGEAVVITTRYRPVRGSRGFYRANVRHGVSKIHSGKRFTLGIIFHDGK